MIFQIERVNSVNSHMVFNLYLNIALVSIWYILTRSWKRTIWWKLILYFSALTFIFGILSISEGRIGLVTGFSLMLSFIFFEIWKRKKLMGIVLMFLIPFLLFGVLHHRERMTEKYIKTEPRVFLWEAALSVIKEKPIFGYGISNAQEQYDIARAKYQTEEYRLSWKHIRILTSHNQFLQTPMEFGILGLIILLFLFFYPIFHILLPSSVPNFPTALNTRKVNNLRGTFSTGLSRKIPSRGVNYLSMIPPIECLERSG